MSYHARVLLFRLTLFAILGLAQGYLFIRLRGAVRRTDWSAGLKATLVWLTLIVIAHLYLLNAYIVVCKLTWVDPPLLAQLGLFYPVAIWNFGSLFSALLLAVLRSLGHIRRAVRRLQRHIFGLAAPIPIDPERRRLLQAGVGTLASAPLVFSAYGAASASMGPEVGVISLPFGRSLRLVQLTDIHAGLYMTRQHMRRYVNLVNRQQPDLVALTGDFISNSMTFLDSCVEEMSRLRSRYGVFVILGNHDHWYGDPAEIRARFRERGFIVLHNSHRVVETPSGPFAVAGIDDLQAGEPDLDRALRGASSHPTILLSHHPEVFPEAVERKIPLTLAGHWHGGQVTLRVLGLPISPAHLLSRYPQGLYRRNGSHLYVSRGIGTTAVPIRLNAPPEVAVFQLT